MLQRYWHAVWDIEVSLANDKERHGGTGIHKFPTDETITDPEVNGYKYFLVKKKNFPRLLEGFCQN